MTDSDNRIEALLAELLSSHQTLLKEVSALRELVGGELELKRKREDTERKRASAFMDSILSEDSA